MSKHRVVVVDDDRWKREAMSVAIAADPRTEIVAVIDQDEAVRWPLEKWQDVDVAVVDVFDENAPGEVGTDVYSGIAALDRIRDLPVRTVAVTPHCQHPLIQLRIYQAGVDSVYHRWEVNDPGALLAAVLEADPAHAPVRPTDAVLKELGAVHARPNDAVRMYEMSPFLGLIREGIGLKSLDVPRRVVQRFRFGIADTGFDGAEETSAVTHDHLAPRWPDVRDYLLTLLGRRATPPTEVDRNDLAPRHEPMS